MKLHELFLTQEDQAKAAEQKLKGLKRSIEDGDAPEIHNAGSTIQGPAWRDLEQLGYAEKEQKPAGRTEIEERWVLKPDAPGPITLLVNKAVMTDGGVKRSVEKKVMQPGDATDWITVDYS